VRAIVELEQRIVGRRRLLVEHVEAGAEQLAGGEGRGHRLLVDHGPARGVDDDGRRLHRGELLGAQHALSRGVERHMQRDDVGVAQDLGQQAEAHAQRILFLLLEPLDVVVVHDHAECLGQTRYLLADGAQPDDAQHLVADFVDGGRLVAVPAAGRDVGVLGDQPARHRQHQEHGVLGDGDRVGAAVVAQRHAAFTRGRKVGAVVARAQHLDQF
jgi:hypothetical protein